MKEYVIADINSVVFGRFKEKKDRDEALKKYVDMGFPQEREAR